MAGVRGQRMRNTRTRLIGGKPRGADHRANPAKRVPSAGNC